MHLKNAVSIIFHVLHIVVLHVLVVFLTFLEVCVNVLIVINSSLKLTPDFLAFENPKVSILFDYKDNSNKKETSWREGGAKQMHLSAALFTCC